TLPKEALIVDVGGGVGSTALQIAKATPHVRIIVQDRASVIKDATTVSHHINIHLTHELLNLTRRSVHDFFTSQPDRSVTVFLPRWILHYWANPAAINILQTLRRAATKETKLITIEIIIP
ncbi:O-methyltransferase, partial [Mycena olivaceomarginata]